MLGATWRRLAGQAAVVVCAAGGKKHPQMAEAFGREHTFGHLKPVVKEFGIREPELAAHGAEPQVPRAEHETGDARGDEGPCAHRARLQR